MCTCGTPVIRCSWRGDGGERCHRPAVKGDRCEKHESFTAIAEKADDRMVLTK